MDPATAEQPSQVQRLEAQAEAGPGASDTTMNDHLDSEKATDSSLSESPEPVIESKHEVAQQAPRSKGKILLLMGALCMAVFLAALDITIITTALPTISAHFNSSEADYTWIGSAYTLAAAAATPLWGKFSDIWGRKPIVLGANVVFFVGSLIAAVSVNVHMLIGGRIIQGIGGGGLLILVNICISDLFSMRERGIYFGMVGMTWAVASGVGPILGGVFAEKVSWRWCFYINLPCDGLAFAVLLAFLDIETPKTPLIAGLKAIDWLGCLLVVGGTVMFLLGLEFGGITYPWSSAIVVCLIVFGLVTLGIFFLVEWKVAKYPVMPLRLFKKRSNIAALGVCFCHGFVFISGSYFLPLYFQAVLGATPILSGVYLFPFVLSLSLMAAGTGVFIRKTGQYLPPIWFGLTFMTIGFGLYIDFPAYASWPRIIIFQIIAGLGTGPLFQAPLIALQSLVQPRDIATATATFGFVRNIATSMSIVMGGVIFQNQMEKKVSMLRGSLGDELASELGGGSAGANTAIVRILPPMQKAVATEAYTSSLQTMWIFYVCIAALGLAVSLAIGRQTLSKTHEVQKQGLEEQERHRKERKVEKGMRGMQGEKEVVGGEGVGDGVGTLVGDEKVKEEV